MPPELQVAVRDTEGVPGEGRFAAWVDAAIRRLDCRGDNVGVRVVDETEMTTLNQQYRGKSGSTNVLSFPFEGIEGVEENYLGDLVICAPVVRREAEEQGKSLEDHWAHLVIHGILHLGGFDHEEDAEADRMEGLEREILADLGIADPYRARA